MELTHYLKSGLQHLTFMCILLFVFSCVDEDVLDLPPDESEDELTESTAIISLLRGVQREQLSEQSDCFSLLYPIKLGYNNGLTITIENFSGLYEVATNQTSGQHINEVEFPFTVSKLGAVRTIEDEDSLLDLLDDCEIPTFRDELDFFYTQCFDFDYPIEMVNLNEDIVTINSQEEYFDFEFQQGFEEQPIFIYPLDVFKYSEDRTIPIENDFELFQIFDGCKKCPNLFFESALLEGTLYQFTAAFPEKDQIPYDWFIDGEKIESDGIGGDNIFTREFESGTYEICMKTRLENDDCFEGIAYCETITVEDPCPFIFFESEAINNNTYLFTANFPLQDEIEYSWAIYINDDRIFFEEEGPDGDDLLEFQFDFGTFNVCIEAEVSGCPQVLKHCEQIVIQQ